MPIAEYAIERKNRRVPSLQYAQQLLWKMVEVRPPPDFRLHSHLKHAIADQTYLVQGRGCGAGSKYTNPVNRLDGKGDKIKIQRRVYINSLDVGVSARECTLSAAAISLIARRGPYTEVHL